MPMASCVHNGDNETKIALSQSMATTFRDNQGIEIEIKDSSQLIEFWIPRDVNLPDITPYYVNITEQLIHNNSFEKQHLFPIGFSKTGLNSSIHLEISPLNSSIGYLVLLKLNMTPRINSTFQDYTFWKMFCPSGNIFSLMKYLLITLYYFSDLQYSANLKKQAYLFFMNSKEIGGYRGFVGIGIRELNNDEIFQYCLNFIKPTVPPSSNNPVLFSSDFIFFAYTSGCYYIDGSTGKWSTYGVEIMSDSTLSYTHCKSNHLTTFAGGLDVLSVSINFYLVFSNSSFEQNKTIYLTVLILFCLYILFSIWGRWMDKQDYLKIGVTPLIDNFSNHEYFYEIIVFTSNRVNAGTNSKVINNLFK
jgi:hypothetical protein